MTSYRVHFRALFVALSVPLTALVVACVPPKGGNSAPPQTRLVSISDKASACEAQLRKQMAKKTLSFAAVNELAAEIASSQGQISSLSQANYYVRKVKQAIADVTIEHFKQTKSSKVSLKYTISNPGKDSKSLLRVYLKLNDVQSTSARNLTQNFNVDDDCQLHLTETSEDQISKVSSGHYRYSNVSYYIDGTSESKNEDFQLAEGEYLIDLATDFDDLRKIPAKGYSFVGTVGLVTMENHQGPPLRSKEFGLELNLQTQNLKLSFQGKEIVALIYGIDETLGLSFFEMANQRTWKLPKAIWENSVLGSSEDLNALVNYKLPKNYLYTHGSLQIIANKMPSYDHFAAYWTISNRSKDNKTGLETMILTENPQAQIQDKASAKDLESNDTIETQLPKIQEIAKSILAQEPRERIPQVQLILNYLKDNYKYDHEMVNNNIVRQLSTAEALERGKGVCQHYAVIFTAIARALKIPTRIVTGYYLGVESAGAHAWVEIEREPGLWRVVEPQSENTLLQMDTRYYFPTGRAEILEDKKTSLADWIKDVMNENFTFLPAP